MTEVVKRQLWQQGSWIIEYHSECPVGEDCWGHGKCVTASPFAGWRPTKCWHADRFWKRNRTLMECLCEALEWVTHQNEEKAKANEEANLLAEEAQALAEAAQSLATLGHA